MTDRNEREEHTDMEEMVAEIYFLRERLKKDEERIRDITKQLIAQGMGPEEQIAFVGPDGEKRAGKMVFSERSVVDAMALYRRLPKDVWDEISRPTVMQKKLIEALKAGKIDPGLVAEFTETVKRAPYVTF